MFHIVFNINDAYAKYCAVTITSIIQATNSKKLGGGQTNSHKKNEKYVFHILTENLTQTTQEKFQALAKSLNNTYPCEILIYPISDKEFQNCPKLHGTYTTYLRLKSASILPKNITKCLYLDVDLFALSDLRDIFAIALGDNLLAAVGDFNTNKYLSPILSTQPYNFNPNAEYFNAGVMLLNLQQWRKEQLETKIFQFLSTYQVQYHDQDTINAVAKNRILKLNPKWNLGFLYQFALENGLNINFNGGDVYLPYTLECFKEAMQSPVILHYHGNRIAKPWESVYTKIDPQMNGYLPLTHTSYQKWWAIAQNTPIFNKELMQLQQDLKESALQDYTKSLNDALKMRDTFFTQKIQALEMALQNLIKP